MVTEFEIGTWGWEHASWQGRFYPDDLPEEWRLGYYANEYRVGVIPTAYWQPKRSLTLIEEWADELCAPFRLFLEMPVPFSLAQFQGLPVAGLLVNSAEVDVSAWPGLPILYQQPAYKEFTLWSDSENQIMVGVISLAETLSPLALRALLTEFGACAALVGEAYLFVDGSPPVLGLVEKLRVICSLL